MKEKQIIWQRTGKGQYEKREVEYTPAGKSQGAERKPTGFPPLVFIGGIATGIALMLFIRGMGLGTPNSLSQSAQRKIGRLEKVIDQYYIGERSPKEEEDWVYRGIVGSLGDKYAAYYNKDDLKLEEESDKGEFSGIGVTITMDQEQGYCYVAEVNPGYPAEKAGIEKGDIFLEVDGESAQGWTASDISAHVKGPTGTDVKLTMQRGGEELEFVVTRAKIEVVSVYSEMKDEKAGIGYIRIAQFDIVTVDQFRKALEGLESQGMKGLILDLRDNPGGIVNSSTEIGSMMLPKGVFTYSKMKSGKKEEWNTTGEREINIPVIVLVNEGTASAAEMLTGALRDYGKATILGTTTYGKGIIQNIYSLGDGSAVEITVGEYYLPNGECIHERGIDPDIVLEFDEDRYKEKGEDNQLEEALKILKK